MPCSLWIILCNILKLCLSWCFLLCISNCFILTTVKMFLNCFNTFAKMILCTYRSLFMCFQWLSNSLCLFLSSTIFLNLLTMSVSLDQIKWSLIFFWFSISWKNLGMINEIISLENFKKRILSKPRKCLISI